MPTIPTSKTKAAEAKKLEADRLHGFLQEMLREEENKYCADCEQKQPRWASWNLGVFLCIRCAGLHRNLGVHISKVKSVTLDSWTPEQVQSMRVMGNAKARAVYEAELPQLFRRPQTDQSLEQFIRAKYETKRYLLKDWSPPCVNVSDLPAFPESNEKKVFAAGNIVPERHQKGSIIKKTASHLRSVGETINGDNKRLTTTHATQQAPVQQLIDLSFTHAPSQSINLNSKEGNTTNIDDLFGPIVSAAPCQQQTTPLSLFTGMPFSVSSPNLLSANANLIVSNPSCEQINVSNLNEQMQQQQHLTDLLSNSTNVSPNKPTLIDSDLIGLDLSLCSVSGSAAQHSSNLRISESNSTRINAPSLSSDTKKSTNEILALFNK